MRCENCTRLLPSIVYPCIGCFMHIRLQLRRSGLDLGSGVAKL